jgi:hypothetical protein
MNCRIKLDDEIENAKQHESFKQMLLRLLDDPQIQEKIGSFLRRSGLARFPIELTQAAQLQRAADGRGWPRLARCRP